MNNGADPEQNDPRKSVQVEAKLLASNHLRPLGYELRIKGFPVSAWSQNRRSIEASYLTGCPVAPI
jgi:hypothetical protein